MAAGSPLQFLAGRQGFQRADSHADPRCWQTCPEIAPQTQRHVDEFFTATTISIEAQSRCNPCNWGDSGNLKRRLSCPGVTMTVIACPQMQPLATGRIMEANQPVVITLRRGQAK